MSTDKPKKKTRARRRNGVQLASDAVQRVLAQLAAARERVSQLEAQASEMLAGLQLALGSKRVAPTAIPPELRSMPGVPPQEPPPDGPPPAETELAGGDNLGPGRWV